MVTYNYNKWFNHSQEVYVYINETVDVLSNLL